MREKAKIVLLLTEDEEKRKEERDFAMKTKDKLTKAPNGKTHKPRAKQKKRHGALFTTCYTSVACSTKQDEQTQRCRVSFELTKPDKANLV